MNLSWNAIDMAIEQLATKIYQNGIKIDIIYTKPRGGLIPAVMLSHRLGLPIAEHYSQCQLKTVLLVDDIFDTGKTMQIMAHEIDTFSIVAAAIASRFEEFTVDHALHEAKRYKIFHAYKVPYTCNWVRFPWEVNAYGGIQ